MNESLKPYNSDDAKNPSLGWRPEAGIVATLGPTPGPYRSRRDVELQISTGSEHEDPRESCDRTMITPTPIAEEKPHDRDRLSRHGFPI